MTQDQTAPASTTPEAAGPPLRLGLIGCDVGGDPAPQLGGEIGRVERRQSVKGTPSWPATLIQRIIAELAVFHQVPQSIYAEAIHASIEPETQDCSHRLPHLGMTPVQVGLLREVGMVVVLSSLLIKGPCWPPKNAEPVVGKPTIRGRMTPDIPVAARIIE